MMFMPSPVPGTPEYAALARELGVIVNLAELIEPERGQIISFEKAKARRERRQADHAKR
jgi:hypothetical protein